MPPSMVLPLHLFIYALMGRLCEVLRQTKKVGRRFLKRFFPERSIRG
jgi:hypothetical protein